MIVTIPALTLVVRPTGGCGAARPVGDTGRWGDPVGVKHAAAPDPERQLARSAAEGPEVGPVVVCVTNVDGAVGLIPEGLAPSSDPSQAATSTLAATARARRERCPIRPGSTRPTPGRRRARPTARVFAKRVKISIDSLLRWLRRSGDDTPRRTGHHDEPDRRPVRWGLEERRRALAHRAGHRVTVRRISDHCDAIGEPDRSA